MFTVIKRMEISASHKLVLPYRSKCASLHGHNWIITVYCRSSRLNYFHSIRQQKTLPDGFAGRFRNAIK